MVDDKLSAHDYFTFLQIQVNPFVGNFPVHRSTCYPQDMSDM